MINLFEERIIWLTAFAMDGNAMALAALLTFAIMDIFAELFIRG